MGEQIYDFHEGPVIFLKWKANELLSVGYVSPNIKQYGYQLEDFENQNQSFYEMICPEDVVQVRLAWQKNVISNKEYFEHKYRILTPRGELRWVHGFVKIVRGRPKSILGYEGYLIDITESVKMKEKLNSSKHLKEQVRMASMIFENTIEGIVLTDLNGNIQWVNPAFTQITGYSAEEAIGKNPRILRSKRHDNDFYKNMWETIRTKGQWKGEIWNRRKNGEIYPEWLTIQAIKDEYGQNVQYVSIFNDITEQFQQEERIKYQTYHDALTELPNRALLKDRLSMALIHANKNGKMTAVMVLDLDRFKRINDTLGHPTGDILLQQAAKRLKACIGEGDTVSRLGGDEFAILLEDIQGAEKVLNNAQNILYTLEKPFRIMEHDLHISTSIGISIYPIDGEDIDTLLKNADTAMYQAKQEGRNRYRLYAPMMNDKALQRLAMENELRKALSREELMVYYQPQIDLKTGQLIGAEALVRWNHPELGFLSPAEFIPLAEETGLIKDLGDFVLKTACRQNKEWQDRGLKKISIAVNLSPLQFQHKNLLCEIKGCLKEIDLDPRYLELEITESSAIKNPDLTIKTLKELKKIGIQLAIDDFGTGYSSLGLLHQLPLDKLKIDKSFLKNIMVDQDSQAIVSAIVAMAKSLGLKVLAEGVEEREQLLYLRDRQCDQIQGYIISAPVAASNFEAFLKCDWQIEHASRIIV